MDDKADIGFIDSHSEGDGGADDMDFVAQKEFLVACSGGVIEAGVIGEGGDAVGDEFFGDAFGGFAAGAVDDSAFAAATFDKAEGLFVRFGFGDDAVGEVGAIETGDIGTGVTKAEVFDDIDADAFGGGGGEGHEGHLGEDLAEFSELAIFGAEIVTPFGNAVGFIDSELGDIPLAEEFESAIEEEAFWGGVEESIFASEKSAVAAFGLGGGEGRIDESGGDAAGVEGVDLIFHESDQWGDDHCETWSDEGGELEAEGFSSTGGEEGKDITIGEGIVDDFFLEWAKEVVTERLLERAKEIVGGHEIGVVR